MGLKKFAKKAGKDIGKAVKKAGQDIADVADKALNQQIIPAVKAAAQELRHNQKPKVAADHQAQLAAALPAQPVVQPVPAQNFQQQIDTLSNRFKALQEQVQAQQEQIKAQLELSTNAPDKNAVVEGAAATAASAKDTADVEDTVEGAAPATQARAVTTTDIEESQRVVKANPK